MLLAASPAFQLVLERWLEDGRNIGVAVARASKACDSNGVDAFAAVVDEFVARGLVERNAIGSAEVPPTSESRSRGASCAGRGSSIQRRPLALIEPGEGNCREAKEARSRVAVATWRGPDEGVAARTEPGDHQCK